MNVCVHCNESFHRGPVLMVASMRLLTGVDGSVFLNWLGTRRVIWQGHFDIPLSTLDRDVALMGAMVWAKEVTPSRSPNKRARTGPAPAAVASWPCYAYRCMRGDGADLQHRTSTDKPTPDEPLELRRVVARAVARGSNFRSPFLHFTLQLAEAMKWCVTYNNKQNIFWMLKTHY